MSNLSSKNSSWHAIRRCLVIVRQLQQGHATKQTLLDAVYRALGQDAYDDVQGENLDRRFEQDKRRLREELGITVKYVVSLGYMLDEWEYPLLNLADEQLRTLAFLADTFQPASPHAPNVQQLVDTLLSWVSEDRQRVYSRARGILPDVDLRLRDHDNITPDVWEAVQYAYHYRQQLEFDYLSIQQTDGIPRQHIVEPWNFYFSERGHYRIDGYCLFNDGPKGSWHPNRYFNYRLGSMVPNSVRVLPTKLPPTPRAQRPYEVIYELAPQIARFGVSRRDELLGEPIVMTLDEGWVRVEGETHDVFHLARNLLYYGGNCRVLGGPELLKEMRQLVKNLGELYQ